MGYTLGSPERGTRRLREAQAVLNCRFWIVRPCRIWRARLWRGSAWRSLLEPALDHAGCASGPRVIPFLSKLRG